MPALTLLHGVAAGEGLSRDQLGGDQSRGGGRESLGEHFDGRKCFVEEEIPSKVFEDVWKRVETERNYMRDKTAGAMLCLYVCR